MKSLWFCQEAEHNACRLCLRAAAEPCMWSPPDQSGRVMPAEEAAEAIAAAIMRPTPPREIVTGARVRTALLAGFIQKWVWPSFVERKFMTMFGLSELGKQAV